MRIISHFSVLECKFLACCGCKASTHCLRLCLHACVYLLCCLQDLSRIVGQMSMTRFRLETLYPADNARAA